MLGSRIAEMELFDYNKGFLYRYNDHVSKLTVCTKVRKRGYELADGCAGYAYTPKGAAGNEEKLPENVRRAKSKVFELALCNDFTYFCTLTFSPEKVKDRYDLEGCMKAFCKWLNNYNCRKASSAIQYLLIPEPHQDGAWHLHGLKQKELLYSAPDCVLPDPDYTGTYSKIKNATTPEELLFYFTLEKEEGTI